MRKLVMLSKMIPWQRRLESEAMKIMLHNPGIVIQTTPVIWGGGEQPYQFAFNMHISERGTYCAHFAFTGWDTDNIKNVSEWYAAMFTNVLGEGYELPTHKSK